MLAVRSSVTSEQARVKCFAVTVRARTISLMKSFVVVVHKEEFHKMMVFIVAKMLTTARESGVCGARHTREAQLPSLQCSCGLSLVLGRRGLAGRSMAH